MDETAQNAPYDLCVIGAGMAGLNALAVAADHLPPGSSVLLVDARDGVGGMWRDVYAYVRLHQPHRLFTAGAIPWRSEKPPEHLAGRTEVLEHAAHCLEVLGGRLRIDPCFGHRLLEHEEVPDEDGHLAAATLAPARGDGPSRRVLARRLVVATGLDVPSPEPLRLASRRVRSMTPEQVPDALDERPDPGTPILVVGGGKTGTDVAAHLLRSAPHRPVEMYVGRGVAFFDRDAVFPTGAGRHFGGTLTLDAMVDLARGFDGTNAEAVMGAFVEGGALHLPGDARQCLLATVSRAEMRELADGLAAVHHDYLEDVVDRDDEPIAMARAGGERRLEPGTWIVNASGRLLRGRSAWGPILSEHGRILRVHAGSAIFHTGLFDAYFLTHLWFLDRIPGTPVYALDHERLFQRDRTAYLPAVATQLVHNLLAIAEHAPAKVLLRCGINFDNWYPAHRGLLALLRARLRGRPLRAHLERSLQALDARHDLGLTSLAG